MAGYAEATKATRSQWKLKAMKVLVCGGRDYHDGETIQKHLGQQHRVIAFTHLIHGNAPGADRIAGEWARLHGVQEVICPAQWEQHGKAAGPIRNRRMLDLEPHLCIAFPGGRGTEDMVKAAMAANVQVFRPVPSANPGRSGG